FVISTEGRNRTRDSTKIGDILYGVSSAISPFGRNDKTSSKKPYRFFLSGSSISMLFAPFDFAQGDI
ncbi:hypothetical protein, partial [Flavobacterium sp. VMW]|uniref:hypothetical protein n=1 Tax=Flavobacterium sp. VMW TaxID=1699134 RepID=UPI001A943B2E